MIKHKELFFSIAIFLIAALALFGEQVDYFMGKVLKFMLFLPTWVAVPLCIIGLAIVGTWAVVRSSRNHWPSDTEFENNESLPHNED